MATPLLVLIILAIVIIASIITSVVTYVILSGRNKRIRLAEQYRQLGITEQYLKIQDEIERIIRYKDIKLTTASPVKMSNPEDGQNEKETESGTFTQIEATPHLSSDRVCANRGNASGFWRTKDGISLSSSTLM